MKQTLFGLLATTGILLIVLKSDANGQENLPFGPSNYEHDFQMFAPFDLDLDNQADKQWSGYFFEYNKLFWMYTGERVTVGNPDVVQFAEVIYRFNPATDLGEPPPPHQVHNELEDVPPKAGFAMGNRYEIGYRDNGHGWTIGVLDGPQLLQSEFYGFVRQDTNDDGVPDGLPPFRNPDYTNGGDIADPGNIFQQSNGPIAGGDLRAFGFGAVPVLFATPPGYLLGFRDYLNFLAGATIGTQVGPIAWVGNYGASTEDLTLPINFFRLTDDINENGIPGAVAIDVNGDGVIDIVTTDFGDLHEFNIFFDNVTVRNRTQTDGVEAMWTHELTNQHYMAKHQNNHVTVSWGARFLRLYDEFDVNAEGSILGNSFWETSFTNNIVGPQVGVQWVNERQRWRIQADGRFMFGYNIANWDQIGLMGEELIPGAVNRLLYARPTAFSHGLREQQFSPIGEMRVSASYHFTEAFALKFGYTGSVVGGIRRAAPSVKYFLPDMGFVDAGTQELLINGFDLGVEFIH
jgi:hypothetical protein